MYTPILRLMSDLGHTIKNLLAFSLKRTEEYTFWFVPGTGLAWIFFSRCTTSLSLCYIFMWRPTCGMCFQKIFFTVQVVLSTSLLSCFMEYFCLLFSFISSVSWFSILLWYKPMRPNFMRGSCIWFSALRNSILRILSF